MRRNLCRSASRVASSRARVVLALVIGIMVAGTFVAIVQPLTADAAGRTLTVTPASSLTDQAVKVSWSGFTPTTPEGLNQVIVVQCTEHPSSLADCFTEQPFPSSANGNEVVNGVTRSDGTGSVQFEVRPAAQLPALDCSEAHLCSIIAFENQVVPDGQLPTLSATARLTFAKSTADCPKVMNFDVRVEGEASGAPILYDWAARRCTGNNPLVIDYTETSSDSGRGNFLKRQVDVGVTSLPTPASELAAVPNHPSFAYAPIDLTAVAVVYNMSDPTTNERINDLTLSPRLLARLISDTDLPGYFQDPDFTRLNPGHTFPFNGISTPLIRAEGNAATWITTNWIASNDAASKFLAGADPDGIPVNASFQNVAYPTDIFENRALDDAYLPRLGQELVASHVFYGARPADTSPLDPASTGFVGIVDLATARRFDLPIARIVNGAGKAVAPDDKSILAGYHAMVSGADATQVADPASKDSTAYPLVKIDYAMVPTQPDDAHRVAIQDLLTWGVTAGQTDLPAGYLPLPDELVAQTKHVADSLSGTTDGPTGFAPDGSSFGSGDFGASAFDSGSPYAAPAGGASDATAAAAGTSPAKSAAERQRALLAASSVAGAGARYVLPVLLLLAFAAALAVSGRWAWAHLSVLRQTRAASADEGTGASS